MDTLPENPSSTPGLRALRLLRFVAEGGSTRNLSEAGRLIDVNRVTLMRLLESLQGAGFIEANAEGGHRIGMRFLTLAASALGSFDLSARARQILPALSAATAMSSYLVVRDGVDVVYLLRETAETALVSRIRVGSRLPAHRATPGLVMLAGLTPPELEALYPSASMVSQADQSSEPPDWNELLATLETVRARQCAWSYSGLEADIDSCAAPIRDGMARTVAALSVAGPSARFEADPALRERVERAVKAAAQEISDSLL